MSKDIREMIDKVKNYKPAMNEGLNLEKKQEPIIEFDGLKVNYQLTLNGKLMEIEGRLNPYHTGRSEEYEFEPNYYMDGETETYYEDNWETIEDQIINKFYQKN